MNMMEWAENEVKNVFDKRNANEDDSCYLYTKSCYESALNAYKTLVNDGHSGASWIVTINILERLIHNLPLTAIEDTDDVWSPAGYPMGNGFTSYQCNRRSSFWKDVYDDGHIEYHDTARIVCADINNPDICRTNGHTSEVVEEHPEIGKIVMPYSPNKPIIVYCDDFLCDEKNVDFDTKGIFYAVKPDGTRVDINRFFTESGNGWKEITKEEYEEMKARKIK